MHPALFLMGKGVRGAYFGDGGAERRIAAQERRL